MDGGGGPRASRNRLTSFGAGDPAFQISPWLCERLHVWWKACWWNEKPAPGSRHALHVCTWLARPLTSDDKETARGCDVPIRAARAYRWRRRRHICRQVGCSRRRFDWRPCCALQTLVASVTIHRECSDGAVNQLRSKAPPENGEILQSGHTRCAGCSGAEWDRRSRGIVGGWNRQECQMQAEASEVRFVFRDQTSTSFSVSLLL